MRAARRVLAFQIVSVLTTRRAFPPDSLRILNDKTPCPRSVLEMFEIQPTPVKEVKLSIVPVPAEPEKKEQPDFLAYQVPEEKRKRQERISGSCRVRERRKHLREMRKWHSQRTAYMTIQTVNYALATDETLIETVRIETCAKHQGRKTRVAQKYKPANGANHENSQLGVILSQLKRIANLDIVLNGKPKHVVERKMKPYKREIAWLTKEARNGHDKKHILESVIGICSKIRDTLSRIKFQENDFTVLAYEYIDKYTTRCGRIMEKCRQMRAMFEQQEK